jgi:TPR repeat protein
MPVATVETPAAPPPAAPSDPAGEPDRGGPDEQATDAPPSAPACGTGPQCYAQARAAARKQPERAAELFAEACDQDHARGCSELAVLYEAGRGVAQDDRRAKQLRERACALGSTSACDELGH